MQFIVLAIYLYQLAMFDKTDPSERFHFMTVNFDFLWKTTRSVIKV